MPMEAKAKMSRTDRSMARAWRVAGKGNGHHGGDSRDHGQDRCHPEEDAVHALGHQQLLGHQLDAVGQRLQQPVGTDLLGADPALDMAGAFPFAPAEIGGIEAGKGHYANEIRESGARCLSP